MGILKQHLRAHTSPRNYCRSTGFKRRISLNVKVDANSSFNVVVTDDRLVYCWTATLKGIKKLWTYKRLMYNIFIKTVKFWLTWRSVCFCKITVDGADFSAGIAFHQIQSVFQVTLLFQVIATRRHWSWYWFLQN